MVRTLLLLMQLYAACATMPADGCLVMRSEARPPHRRLGGPKPGHCLPVASNHAAAQSRCSAQTHVPSMEFLCERPTQRFRIREGAVLGSANMQESSSLDDDCGGISPQSRCRYAKRRRRRRWRSADWNCLRGGASCCCQAMVLEMWLLRIHQPEMVSCDSAGRGWDWMRGVRVGEAERPGPEGSSAEGFSRSESYRPRGKRPSKVDVVIFNSSGSTQLRDALDFYREAAKATGQPPIAAIISQEHHLRGEQWADLRHQARGAGWNRQRWNTYPVSIPVALRGPLPEEHRDPQCGR